MGDRITGTERRLAGAGWPGGGPRSVRRRRPRPLPSRINRPRAPGPPPAARASWGTLGPARQPDGRRGPGAARARVGGSGVEWTVEAHVGPHFRLGRAGAGRGGVGRDASADRIPPVPRGRRHSAETAGRGVAGRAGSWNGNASAARSGRGRCRCRSRRNPYRE